MKSLILSMILLISFFPAGAQCNEFWHLEDGGEWEYEMMNAKGKTTGKTHQTVKSFEKNAEGFTAIIRSVVSDEKGKEMTSGDLEYKCNDGTLYMDMRNFVPEQQLKSMSSYEIKLEADHMEIPSTLQVGQSLKDGSLTMTATNSPVAMKMIVNIVDRKVVGKESVQTPAGKFDCYKISSKSIVKNQMGIAMTFEYSYNEWIAPKVGMVKSETFNKKGKLQSTSILSMRK